MKKEIVAMALATALATLSPHAWAQDPNASGDAARLPIDAAVDATYKAISIARDSRKPASRTPTSTRKAT